VLTVRLRVELCRRSGGRPTASMRNPAACRRVLYTIVSDDADGSRAGRRGRRRMEWDEQGGGGVRTWMVSANRHAGRNRGAAVARATISNDGFMGRLSAADAAAVPPGYVQGRPCVCLCGSLQTDARGSSPWAECASPSNALLAAG
jgi:hypothetical protein